MANIGYIQVTRHCNQTCRFCSNPINHNLRDAQEAKALVDDLVARNYFGVILTGGEPTLADYLPEVVRYARDRGLHVRMITNAMRLAEGPLLDELVDAGLHHLHISCHSVRPEVMDFITQSKRALERQLAAMERIGAYIGKQGWPTLDINCVINKYNCDHLDENVRALCEYFPFIRHFVWNNIDPRMNRAADNPDTICRLADFELSLHRAMRFLDATGRTFRVERVPLCYMAEFAHCSTETRKIVKGEERTVHFLDQKGAVNQTDWHHELAAACESCSVADICGRLFEKDVWYDSSELFPLFVSKDEIVRKVWESGEGRQ